MGEQVVDANRVYTFERKSSGDEDKFEEHKVVYCVLRTYTGDREKPRHTSSAPGFEYEGYLSIDHFDQLRIVVYGDMVREYVSLEAQRRHVASLPMLLYHTPPWRRHPKARPTRIEYLDAHPNHDEEDDANVKRVKKTMDEEAAPQIDTKKEEECPAL